ncbi:hypothetical protein VUR80DRAFT_7659 [Thermomyces stellatus]
MASLLGPGGGPPWARTHDRILRRRSVALDAMADRGPSTEANVFLSLPLGRTWAENSPGSQLQFPRGLCRPFAAWAEDQLMRAACTPRVRSLRADDGSFRRWGCGPAGSLLHTPPCTLCGPMSISAWPSKVREGQPDPAGDHRLVQFPLVPDIPASLMHDVIGTAISCEPVGRAWLWLLPRGLIPPRSQRRSPLMLRLHRTG